VNCQVRFGFVHGWLRRPARWRLRDLPGGKGAARGSV